MTTTEFNTHYNTLRLTDARIAKDMRVNVSTVWRWRNGKTQINKITAFVLRQYFANVREEMEKENFTFGDQTERVI